MTEPKQLPTAHGAPVGNIAAALAGVPERTCVRQSVHLYKADPNYACGVAAKLNLSHAGEQVAVLAGLSLAELIAQTSAEAYTAPQSMPAEPTKGHDAPALAASN